MNLFVVAVLTMLMFFAIAMIFGQLGLRKHRGISREEFVKAFSNDGVALDIPATVYDFYKRGVVFKNFSIAPDDTYEDVLHKCDEDIDDDARFLMKKLGLKAPGLEAREQWIERSLSSRAYSLSMPQFRGDSSKLLQPIQTIRDMVLWLD